MKKYQIIDGVRHKAIGYTYDGKLIGWIACGESKNKIVKKIIEEG